MKALSKSSNFKTIYLILTLLLFIVILSLSGCATTPLFSDSQIPQHSNGSKLKIAIQKKDIQFPSGFGNLVGGDNFAIYNCIGVEIYKNIPNADVFLVDKKPINPNIIYIHNFRKAAVWSVDNPLGVIVDSLLVIPGLLANSTYKTTFKADVLINSKSYTIKAFSSHTQSSMSSDTHKLLSETCADFAEKLKVLILQTVSYTQYKSHHKILYYSPQKTNNLSSSYADTDSNFKKLAVYVYKTDSPYIYSHGKYTYNAIPVTTALSGCRIISVIRQINGNSNPKQRNIENYKICKGKISEIRNSNMADWDTLPEDIKPVINKIGNETREYGKASANYYGYKVIGKSNIGDKSVYIYVLKGIRLEAVIK